MVALGELCEIRPSKAEARRKLAPSDPVSFVPMNDLGIGQMYLQPRDMKRLDEVAGSYTYFAESDVLLAKITPCFENGMLGIAADLENAVGFGSSEFMVLRPNPKLLSEYLYYFLDRSSFREAGARAMTGAVGHKRVPPEFVASQLVRIPPLEEQRRIVAVLDEAFAGMATATANAQKNLTNARALFDGHLADVFDNGGNNWVGAPLGRHVQFVDYRGKTPPKREMGIRLITAKLSEHPARFQRLITNLRSHVWEIGLAKTFVDADAVLDLIDYPAYFRLTKRKLPDGKPAILEQLQAEKFIVPDVGGRWNITNFGAILFAADLERFDEALSRKAVRFVAYDGKNRAAIVTHRRDGRKGDPVAGILMSPVFAGAAMALSSFTVVVNALRLNAVELK